MEDERKYLPIFFVKRKISFRVAFLIVGNILISGDMYSRFNEKLQKLIAHKKYKKNLF
jgi:hypothetical protein